MLPLKIQFTPFTCVAVTLIRGTLESDKCTNGVDCNVLNSSVISNISGVTFFALLEEGLVEIELGWRTELQGVIVKLAKNGGSYDESKSLGRENRFALTQTEDEIGSY